MKEPLPYAQLSKGSLLLASPDIDTGLYFRGVILLCEHGPSGSFGLLVNKPLEVEIPEDIINLKDIPNPRVQVRAGGPLQPNQMMLLHTKPLEGEQTLKICDGVFLGGDIQFLQEAMADTSGPAVRLCFGFCGWGPGQLEREFLTGLWFLQPATPEAVFDTPPDQLWRSTLRQMGGKYATLSMIPDDLSLN
ncbi:MAG: YqgE/AlgH family protein [Rhabdochlamydiaceae bacterium]|jgi:putative transcriptional regulator